MFFTLEAKSGKARAGTIRTIHGEIHTPIFMPVGTRASVKTMGQHDLEEIGAEIILGNTYHLLLRPGPQLVEQSFGSLHGFMNWQRPILTDSGGFQVYSLSKLSKVTPTGVIFKSHLDGKEYKIGPIESMEIQKSLGADIIMNFDECPSLPATKDKLKQSMDLTLNWAQICRDTKIREYQKLFGIIQGGLHVDLRSECMEKLIKMGFDGLALGGLSVGEKNIEMQNFLTEFVHTMPEHMPRYLMGVGTPLDILNGIKAGIDMFDCVLPTRNARNGQFLTHGGKLAIKKARFIDDLLPPDPKCSCKVCKRYSRAYIRHLYTVGEYLAGQLITYHNLYFYLNMVREVRMSIISNSFDEYYNNFYKSYQSCEWE